MRLRHFETLRPICPRCRAERSEEQPLLLTVEAKRNGDDVLEGVLQCGSRACRREYPIIDGIPLLVPDVRAYIATHLQHLTMRDDLSFVLEAMLGEGSGPGSALDATRMHLSSYGWDHWAEYDTEEIAATDEEAGTEPAPTPGGIVRVLERGLELAGARPEAPLLDVGCAVGRATFELARRTDGLVLGADLGFAMLRLASRVLRTGTVRYPRRRVGMLYDWREFPVPVADVADRVDFWACDAAHLPFPADAFGGAVGLNVLDVVWSPLDLLRSLRRVVRAGGAVVLSSPYDWTPAATAVEAWIGGHSPRSWGAGRSEPLLRALLTPGAHEATVEGLSIVREVDGMPWTVRLHERSSITYRVHLVAARRS